MKVRKSEIVALLKATFPEYSGRRFFVQPAERITLHDLNWCEGTRNSYRAVTLDGKPIGNGAKFNGPAPWNNTAEGAEVSIPNGVAVACHSFHGMHESVTFYLHPQDMPKLVGMEVR